jgi:hypothetical protein
LKKPPASDALILHRIPRERKVFRKYTMLFCGESGKIKRKDTPETAAGPDPEAFGDLS